jgi:hypothetical protein
MVHKYPALAALKDVIWLESADTTLAVPHDDELETERKLGR